MPLEARDVSPLELELQAVEICPTWVLGIELRPLHELYMPLTPKPPLPDLSVTVFIITYIYTVYFDQICLPSRYLSFVYFLLKGCWVRPVQDDTF